MDIHGYIHVWTSGLSHPVDIFMHIMLAHLVIKLNRAYLYALSVYKIFLSVAFIIYFFHLFILLSQMNNE